ncbi:MAG: NAD-dependent epimerase/dehydratase family protein, partial [Candidatus Omnitrophica bacterium]|nr:NAD-dependent epimerase/dehydratase family protein [Candidatus Omnitrophota bacterium]
IEYVFHLAAATSVEESFARPKFYVENNVYGTINLLSWALKNKVKKIAYAGSGAVYGNVKEGTLMKETLIPAPNSVYGLTKLDAEHLLNIYRLNFGLPCVILRYFNVFGEGQDYSSAYASVIPKFIYLALQGKDLTVYGSGRQTRDFIHIEDVAAATVLAMEKGSGIYNVATGRQMSVNVIARELLGRIKTKSRIVYLPPVPGDSLKDMGCNKRVVALGWRERAPFSARLEQTLRWYIKNIKRREGA